MITGMDEQQIQEYFSSVIVTVNNFLAPYERIIDFKIREKGCLSRDIISTPSGISIPKLQLNLNVQKWNSDESIVRIGDFLYRLESLRVDLQPFLTNPLHWLGNQNLVDFTGGAVFQWYRQDTSAEKIKFYAKTNGKIVHAQVKKELSKFLSTGELSLQGAFDIVLNLNKKLSNENVRDEVNWIILAGSRFFTEELVESFGGYWEEFDSWTGEFVPGDTVAKFLQREVRKKDSTAEKKLYYLQPFFVWNASAAYTNFWKLTGYNLALADPSPGNFIVPSHDYQTGTKIVSFSERMELKSIRTRKKLS